MVKPVKALSQGILIIQMDIAGKSFEVFTYRSKPRHTIVFPGLPDQASEFVSNFSI